MVTLFWQLPVGSCDGQGYVTSSLQVKILHSEKHSLYAFAPFHRNTCKPQLYFVESSETMLFLIFCENLIMETQLQVLSFSLPTDSVQ